MSIFVKHLQQTKVRKTNINSHIVMDLFLILVILLITSCTPQINNAYPADSQPTQRLSNTQVVRLADTPTPIPNLTAILTSSPFMLLTSTQAVNTSPSLTFLPDADAYAKESKPSTNYGNKPTLIVGGGSDPDESFIRFTVTKLSGTVQSALLRLHTTTNGSNNGPAVYATSISWSEEEIAWNKSPIPSGEALDNKGSIKTETWVEYNVTAAVKGNGMFSFVLIGDSKDAVTFSSRESEAPPELVITFTPNLAPTPTLAPGDVTFVGAGEISMCTNDNDELTAKLLDGIPGTVFTTGDNAYPDGKYDQFINCYDPTWGRHKDRTFPVPGNHDYHTSNATAYYQYFNNIPSYYAYDLGSWRIYALNSEIGVAEGSKQVRWLQVDLAIHPSHCILAYWNQPRWSSGTTHGSSLQMQTLWQILYEGGAELVLNGYEHNYERFMPMNIEGQPDPLGLREIVVGTGGGTLDPFGAPLSTTEVRNDSTYGVLKLTLRSNSYDWQFIPVAGSTFTDGGSTECH